MPKKQRIYSVGDIERGDHLIICKGLTGNQHHLLAIQKGCSGCSLNVIHYNSQGKRSKVTKEKLDLSPRKTPIYRINDRPTGMTVDRVIQKAEKLVGLSKFLPDKNTSEEFVKWCLAEINAKERILKVKDIRRGDHVIIRQFMGLHYHHCLAVEDGTEDNRLNVIHFSNCPKLFGEVVRETISLQPEDKPVFRVNIQCGNLSRDVDEVVGKAEKQLGLRKYSTESNNCENFVKWCQTETRYQERISKVTDILKGDHLITKARRGMHRHHSLAVEDGRPGNVVCVVHYTNGRIVEEDIELNPDERDVFRFIEHKFIGDDLEYADEFTSEDNETDEENAGNAGIALNDDGNESDDDAEIMFVLTDTDKVIEKARRQLNEHKYSNDFNNCEHFVNWCKHQTGHRERVQGLGYVKKGDHVIIDKFLMEHHVLVVQDGSHMNNNIAVIHYSRGQVIEEQMNIDPSKDNVFLFYDDCPEDEEADQTVDVITQARRQVGMKNYCQNEGKSSKHFVFWCKMRRSHREPLYSIADVQKGDHLVIENFRGMKNHHSIVVENSVERRKATIVYHNEDRVIEEEIYVDAEKYKLYCVHDDYYDEDICRDAHENSEKAKRSIGKTVYSLENSSNEHFVHWCKRVTERLKEVKCVQDIKFGDHLIIRDTKQAKTMQTHHMLSVQDCDKEVVVIHVCDCSIVNHATGDAKLHQNNVVAEKVQLDLRKQKVYSIVHADENNTAVDRNIVMKSAHGLLNPGTVSPQYQNCQQFVRHCQGAMLSNVRIRKIADIKKGDHLLIERERGLRYHHVLATEDGAEGQILSTIHYEGSTSGEKVEKVIEEAIQINCEGQRIFRVIYDGHVDPEIVIGRARSQLGQCECSPKIEDGEHFVTWCKTGVLESRQFGNTYGNDCEEGARPLCLVAGDGMRLATKSVAGTFGKLPFKGMSHLVVAALEHSAALSLAASGSVSAAGTVVSEGAFLALDIIRMRDKTNKAILSRKEWEEINIQKWKMAGTFIGGVCGSFGGAIIGQLLIPVPVLGIVVGGVAGGFLGRIAMGVLAGSVGKLTYRADIYKYHPKRRRRKPGHGKRLRALEHSSVQS